MKMTLSATEYATVNEMFKHLNITVESNDVVKVTSNGDSEYIIDIDERYVNEIYGCCNKYLPILVPSVKSVVVVVQTLYNDLNKKETEILAKVKAEKESEKEKSPAKVTGKKINLKK